MVNCEVVLFWVMLPTFAPSTAEMIVVPEPVPELVRVPLLFLLFLLSAPTGR